MGKMLQSALWVLIASAIFYTDQSQAYDYDEHPFDPIVIEKPNNQRRNSQPVNDYYTFNETTVNSSDSELLISPDEIAQEFVENISALAKNIEITLTDWDHHNQKPAQPKEKYNRKKHFGGWIRNYDDGECYNTRARVLIRDSLKKVGFDSSSSCVVTKGLWKDPYTGDSVEDAQKDIQIDHMVPLNNAYKNGAWQWPASVRCTYANFMTSAYHLISAGSHENMRKSDSGPEDYMPPLKSYQCAYLSNWLKIKLSWKINMTGDEGRAIEKLIGENNCKASDFKISKNEILKIRQASTDFKPCDGF